MGPIHNGVDKSGVLGILGNENLELRVFMELVINVAVNIHARQILELEVPFCFQAELIDKYGPRPTCYAYLDILGDVQLPKSLDQVQMAVPFVLELVEAVDEQAKADTNRLARDGLEKNWKQVFVVRIIPRIPPQCGWQLSLDDWQEFRALS